MAALPFWRRAANFFFEALKWVLRTFTRAITVLTAFVLLASAFSDLISPTVWILAAYLGLAFPIILILAVIWTVLMMVTRRWRPAVLMLLAITCCYTRLWRYMPLHAFDPSPVTSIKVNDSVSQAIEVDTFRVLTFNTRATGDAHVRDIKEHIPLMDLVRQSDADVVCLQEYHYSLTTGYTEQKLRDMVKDVYPYYHHLLNSGRKDMGITIFSKWPIRKKEKIDKAAKNYCWATYYELDVRGRCIGLVNCHLHSNTISKADRKLYRQQIEHFEKDSLMRMEDGLRHIGPAFRRRATQTGIINRFLADRKDAGNMPMIICGDMNDTPTSYTYRSMRGTMSDSWTEAGFGPGISFRDAPFWFRIDHVFHSSHFRTLDARVMREIEYSDHYPVMVTLQLLPDNN
ncbi:MAG: endonuclease/exonuclease/phosphatase family protein [Bacteroidales bacterium]|nr:endonuclease/exonuclease/phosphatase family protein [Candidatus Liminaster caballi]